MERFEILLKGSVEAHGHLCSGQVVGVRMAMLGCRLAGAVERRKSSAKEDTIERGRGQQAGS
ncbi:MAG: hypothetical protein KAI86_09955 [Desulfobacterales bacterium]|nr:hypothetical protein [Desulfobacterales bacterium]